MAMAMAMAWPFYVALLRRRSVRLGCRLYSTQGRPGPLAGIRILDLTRVLAGPFCTQILADYGADVIKVEHPQGGSIIIDLIKEVDVVVDNFIPGKLEGIGLGYDILKKANPSIIHASISGYGATGPYARRAGYDVIAAAEGELLHITGERDGPPTKPGVGLMDMATGLYVHGAICAALVGRSQTGQGQKIDASLFETTISLLNNVGMTWLNLGKEGERWGMAHATIVPYDAFQTKDSNLVLGAVNNRQFRVLCARLGDEDIADNPKFVDNATRVQNREELKEILLSLFSRRTNAEWMKVIEGSGLPYGSVNTIEQAFAHPQSTERDMVQTIEHSGAAGGSIEIMGAPVKFNEPQATHTSPPPGLGEHTEEVLSQMGHSSSDIATLQEEGAISRGDSWLLGGSDLPLESDK